MLSQAQPTDLIRYGLIPEFVGRLPVVGVLGDLDKAALMQILTEPKNALIRQYQRLFEFENVRLRFSDDALETVAELALQRKVGARGLRMILEDLMLELMYHLPAQRKLREFVVTGRNGAQPRNQLVVARKSRIIKAEGPPRRELRRVKKIAQGVVPSSQIPCLAEKRPNPSASR